MNVKEMLNTISSLSIGLDTPTDSDYLIFLRYLNLAYMEILRETILKNPLLPKLKETLACNNGIVDPTSQTIYRIICIYIENSNVKLQGTNIDNLLKINSSLSDNSTNPNYYYYDSGNINIYPLYTGNINILYSPQPALLNINSLSSEVYIPELYQSVLIDGASYYLFQSETGFKNELKMQTTMKRWENGKTDLSAYLVSLSGQNYYSTYRPI